ncbi:MAG: MFS transporter [Alphaproteobacteria bacterium]|nr:MFS transporter [Alphaproteobacteria bacterium]
MKTRNPPWRGRLNQAAIMLLVSCLSMILLVYVGYGEAQRNYQQFIVEKIEAQGKIVQNAMEQFLRAGLPMKQFVGFSTVVEPILSSDPTIASFVVVDEAGKRVFAAGPDVDLKAAGGEMAQPSGLFNMAEANGYIEVVLPLRNKFEQVGRLCVSVPRAVVTDRLAESFEWLVISAVVLSVLFAIFTALSSPTLARFRLPWLQISYAMVFLALAAAVITTLIALYSEGAQTKTRALAASLGHRLSEIVEFNLNFNEFEGLDQTLGDYQRLNPDISAAALIINGEALIHSEQELVGKAWTQPPHTYEFVLDLTRPEKSANSVHVAVAMPIGIVYERVARTVKNFAALFIASAFMAGLFLQIASSIQQSQRWAYSAPEQKRREIDRQTALDLVKPVFFLAVFAEHLTYSFLPQFTQKITSASALSDGFTSALFMAYYLFFALTLVPAGHFAQRRGARSLMHIGLVLSGCGLLTLYAPGSALLADFMVGEIPVPYLVLAAGRVLSGIGQAMVFIGVQSYILDVALPQKRTQAAAIIVFGFQGGMISGTAIGSLLVVYMGETGIFMLGSAIAITMALYCFAVVPASRPSQEGMLSLGSTVRELGHNMTCVLRSGDFLRTMVLVGVPTKAVMTGVVLFALPLLLSQANYAPEDIGQIIMLYAGGVLVSSFYVPRAVDRSGNTGIALFWGVALSALGLVLIGAMSWEPLVYISPAPTVVLISGVLLLGLAHGFICAPVVTHVANSELSRQLGHNAVTASYRFLERIGHVAGPLIVGQLFLFWGHQASLVAWIGVAVFISALLFLLSVMQPPVDTLHKETPA